MQRCPACNARPGATSRCGRCGADLGRILLCEQLAAAWLSVALQRLDAGHMDLAVAAIRRSLSLQQTPAAKLVKAFLIQQQYSVLYENFGLRHWRQANADLRRLGDLQGDNEALKRFKEMLNHFSTPHEPDTL